MLCSKKGFMLMFLFIETSPTMAYGKQKTKVVKLAIPKWALAVLSISCYHVPSCLITFLTVS